MKHLTYILECRDGTLYCGYTNNLQARIKTHNDGKGAKYTRSRLPVKLVHSESFESKSLALRREYEIKRMTRAEKLILIEASPVQKNCIIKGGSLNLKKNAKNESQHADFSSNFVVNNSMRVKDMSEREILEDPTQIFNELYGGSPVLFFEKMKRFSELMLRYDAAIMEITTKLQILNKELSQNSHGNPIESIKSRIKKPISIANKLKRKSLEVNVDSMERNLSDIAGLRVVCPFVEDVYKVADMLLMQDDITLIDRKDYIKAPKENGYRSLHLIVSVPVFFSCEKMDMKVEIQIRTVAMDFWASVEHELRYKNNNAIVNTIGEELKNCADIIAETDVTMQRLRNKINSIE